MLEFCFDVSDHLYETLRLFNVLSCILIVVLFILVSGRFILEPGLTVLEQ
jgi:hypothetical protein